MTRTLDDWIEGAAFMEHRGRRIAFWKHGEGRPLLLVHGYPTAAWDWHHVWDALGAHYRVIAADMLGFGLSDKPRGGYSIHAQADLQEAVLTHCGLDEPFDALVHDYGVSVGQELLARQQEGSGAAGLGRVVFLNGGIFPDQHRPVLLQRLGVSPLGPLIGLMMNRKRFGRAFSAVFGPETKPSSRELDDFWRLMTRQDGHRITHKLLHYIADRKRQESRWVGALHGARNRIGLINGALDPVSGRHAWEKWCRDLPDTRERLLEDVGHYPQVEAPQQVAETVLDWLPH